MAVTQLALTDVITLSNDVKIPRLGFGVYASSECVTSCLTALRTGYRHIDTAQVYNNESSVGTAVQQSRLPRNSIFITTKILHPHVSVGASYQSALDSVKRIEGEDGSTRQLIKVGTSICFAQGWFVSTRDLASSVFICAIAVQTFFGVVKDYRLPTPPSDGIGLETFAFMGKRHTFGTVTTVEAGPGSASKLSGGQWSQGGDSVENLYGLDKIKVKGGVTVSVDDRRGMRRRTAEHSTTETENCWDRPSRKSSQA